MKRNAPPTKKEILPPGRAKTEKFVAGLKAASDGRSRIERSFFQLLDDAKGVQKIDIFVKKFVDISGATELPVPPNSEPLQAKDLFCQHAIRVNGRRYVESKRPSIEEMLKFKKGVPTLWRIRVSPEKGHDEIYIPVGVACCPEANLVSKHLAEAIKVCTEASIFLYASDLFVLFSDGFDDENVSKYTVLIQAANSGGLGIIDPRNPNAY